MIEVFKNKNDMSAKYVVIISRMVNLFWNEAEFFEVIGHYQQSIQTWVIMTIILM